MGVDSRELRDALGVFVTGITVITTADADGQPVGVTANSFNSLSLQPPLVLWSLDRRALSMAAFSAAPHFAIHVLAADQASLSERFARRGGDKFTGLAFAQGPGGTPLLDDYAARFLCRRTQVHDGGDHVIFIGEVEAIDATGREPLAFHRGRYGYVHHGEESERLLRMLSW